MIVERHPDAGTSSRFPEAGPPTTQVPKGGVVRPSDLRQGQMFGRRQVAQLLGLVRAGLVWMPGKWFKFACASAAGTQEAWDITLAAPKTEPREAHIVLQRTTAAWRTR